MFPAKLFFLTADSDKTMQQLKLEPFSRSEEHFGPFIAVSGVSLGDANCFQQDATIRWTTFLMLAVKCLAISSYLRVSNVLVSSLCATLHAIY